MWLQGGLKKVASQRPTETKGNMERQKKTTNPNNKANRQRKQKKTLWLWLFGVCTTSLGTVLKEGELSTPRTHEEFLQRASESEFGKKK